MKTRSSAIQVQKKQTNIQANYIRQQRMNPNRNDLFGEKQRKYAKLKFKSVKESNLVLNSWIRQINISRAEQTLNPLC